MKFTDNLVGKFVLGVVFSLFMLLVTLVFVIVLIPVFLMEFLATFLGGSATPVMMFTALIGLLVLLASFLMIGWAVFYFYKKNTFIYRKKR